jgi:hypothetical protein
LITFPVTRFCAKRLLHKPRNSKREHEDFVVIAILLSISIVGFKMKKIQVVQEMGVPVCTPETGIRMQPYRMVSVDTGVAE